MTYDIIKIHKAFFRKADVSAFLENILRSTSAKEMVKRAVEIIEIKGIQAEHHTVSSISYIPSTVYMINQYENHYCSKTMI